MAVTLLDALPWRIGDTVEQYLGPSATDNSVNVAKGDVSKRLVVLLGWGGALQKHLSKLRNFYLSEGYVVLSYISPMSCFLQHGFIEADIDELARSLIRELAEVGDKRFIVHLHSNNGTMAWGALLLALRESCPDALSALAGIVFDSAPRVSLKPHNLVLQAFGFTFACVPILLRKNRYVHPVWTPALFLYLLLRLLALRFKEPASHRFMFDLIREAVVHSMPVDAPQLYIYSTKDMLIASQAVEDYIASQRRRGVVVSTKRFSDTPHVQHFLRKEVEYKEALQTFLNVL